MYLVTGLGNPGHSYLKTRHNVGFMLVDWMAEKAGRKFEPVGSHALTSSIENAGQTVILAKPQTYMNSSGIAIRQLLDHYNLKLTQTLVVYDDLALPLGTIRIRRSGSSSGHKGMRSIIAELGTQDVPRLRIGLSQGEPPAYYSEYVLEPFTKKERTIVEEVLNRSIEAIETILSDGIEQAMCLYN